MPISATSVPLSVVVDVSKSGTLTRVQDAAAIKPAGWLTTTLLFGVPALVFAFLFHQLGPDLWHHGTSWWRIFHLLLILPLALMLVAAFVGPLFFNDLMKNPSGSHFAL